VLRCIMIPSKLKFIYETIVYEEIFYFFLKWIE